MTVTAAIAADAVVPDAKLTALSGVVAQEGAGCWLGLASRPFFDQSQI
jgi:hypothetical protein